MHLQHLILPVLLLGAILSVDGAFCKNPKTGRLLRINPPTLFDPVPFGFTHIAVDTRSLVAHIAGQVAIDRNGKVVGSSLSEQLVLVEKNLRFAMRAVRADVHDIITLKAYLKNFNSDVDGPVFRKTLFRLGSPSSLLLSTPGLALEPLLVEIELTVAVSKSIIPRLRCVAFK